MSELIDNRARGIATLKEIIQRAHNGEAPDAVKGQLREMVRQTNPSEIMAMDQELISGGMPPSKRSGLCATSFASIAGVLDNFRPARLFPAIPGRKLMQYN